MITAVIALVVGVLIGRGLRIRIWQPFDHQDPNHLGQLDLRNPERRQFLINMERRGTL